MWDPCDSGKYRPEIQKQSFDNINFTQQKSAIFFCEETVGCLSSIIGADAKLNEKLTNWQMICLSICQFVNFDMFDMFS